MRASRCGLGAVAVEGSAAEAMACGLNFLRRSHPGGLKRRASLRGTCPPHSGMALCQRGRTRILWHHRQTCGNGRDA
eukprot:7383545-Prymnesium_polylepis.2